MCVHVLRVSCVRGRVDRVDCLIRVARRVPPARMLAAWCAVIHMVSTCSHGRSAAGSCATTRWPLRSAPTA
eukprot:1926740-Alexandrium_andersonii.AAC.1